MAASVPPYFKYTRSTCLPSSSWSCSSRCSPLLEDAGISVFSLEAGTSSFW